MTFRKTVKV